MGLLELLENNFISNFFRESMSIFAYPSLIAMHAIGMAFLVGTSVGVALRMIGFAPELPVSSLLGFFRLMWVGLWINAISGLLLLAQDAQRFLTMPQFYIKLGAIAVAMVLLRKLQRSVRAKAEVRAADPEPGDRAVALSMIGAWLVAIVAGRVTAYAGWVGMQTAIAVVIVGVVLLIGGFIVVRAWGGNRGESETRGRAATAAKP